MCSNKIMWLNTVCVCVYIYIYIYIYRGLSPVLWRTKHGTIRHWDLASTGKCLSSSTHSVESTLRYLQTCPSRWLITSFLNIFNFPFIFMAFSLHLHVAARMFFLEISEHFVLHHTLVCMYYSLAELGQEDC